MAASKQESWMDRKWRPLMAYLYMVVCAVDFIVFPVLWSLLQTQHGGMVTSQWNPITLQGAGLFHLAMGAVLGVTAWSRGQEKLAGVAGYSSYRNQPYNEGKYSGYESDSFEGNVGRNYSQQRPYMSRPVSGAYRPNAPIRPVESEDPEL